TSIENVETGSSATTLTGDSLNVVNWSPLGSVGRTIAASGATIPSGAADSAVIGAIAASAGCPPTAWRCAISVSTGAGAATKSDSPDSSRAAIVASSAPTRPVAARLASCASSFVVVTATFGSTVTGPTASRSSKSRGVIAVVV